jgi:hypothetical protein
MNYGLSLEELTSETGIPLTDNAVGVMITGERGIDRYYNFLEWYIEHTNQVVLLNGYTFGVIHDGQKTYREMLKTRSEGATADWRFLVVAEPETAILLKLKFG